mgnify:CR=1 FL=1
MNIKTTIAAAIIAIMPMAAQAQSPGTTCEEIQSLAALLMDIRQGGAPIATTMEGAGDDPYLRAMVIAAYEQPRFRTEASKQRAIEDFSNEVALKCYAARS